MSPNIWKEIVVKVLSDCQTVSEKPVFHGKGVISPLKRRQKRDKVVKRSKSTSAIKKR